MCRALFGFFALVAPAFIAWWLVLIVWALYSLRFRGYEIIFFGIFFDAFAGYSEGFFLFYTFIAIVISLGINFLRTRLVFFEKFGDLT